MFLGPKYLLRRCLDVGGITTIVQLLGIHYNTPQVVDEVQNSMGTIPIFFHKFANVQDLFFVIPLEP